MGLNLKAKAESAQKERYAGQKHRKAIGEAQNWKCKICQRDISGKGASALDHIIPIARRGTGEPDNPQLLCRRCNSRKSDRAPGGNLDRFMELKVTGDRLVDLCNEVLPPIVDCFIWQDSTEATCRWCQVEMKLVQAPDTNVATVFRCPACKRHFRAGYWDGKEDFYQHVQDAISFSFSWEAGEKVVELLTANDIEGVKRLVAEQPGHLEEVRKCRHSHKDLQAGCWCEYGQDAWKVVNTFDQVTLEVPDPDVGYRQWAAGIDVRMDAIYDVYEADDSA